MRSKSFTTFTIHASPLHGGVDGKDTSDGEGKDKETLEMKTFGKGYKGMLSCIKISERLNSV